MRLTTHFTKVQLEVFRGLFKEHRSLLTTPAPLQMAEETTGLCVLKLGDNIFSPSREEKSFTSFLCSDSISVLFLS